MRKFSEGISIKWVVKQVRVKVAQDREKLPEYKVKLRKFTKKWRKNIKSYARYYKVSLVKKKLHKILTKSSTV